MSVYKEQQSLGYAVPIMILALLGIVYVMSQRAGSEFVSFILVGGAAVAMIYWSRTLVGMLTSTRARYAPMEKETKNWVYDLIKGDGELVFVAEVPGPEDKVAVRLVDGVLYIRGSGRFSKEVSIDGQGELSDFKYRNGVLTLRIKPL